MHERPVKFKLFFKNTGEMSEPYTIKELAERNFLSGELDDVVFLQFTNNEDLKEQEIYDGDIMEHDEGVDAVRWGVDSWTLDTVSATPIGDVRGIIIGNIYTNGND